jgi:hypothetical protein
MIFNLLYSAFAESVSARVKATEASARALLAREASQPVGFPCDVYGLGYESEHWKKANGAIVAQAAYPELFAGMGHVPLILSPTLLRARASNVSALAATPNPHWRRIWADGNGFSALYFTPNDGSGNSAVRLLSTTNFSTWTESPLTSTGSYDLNASVVWGGYCRGLILPLGSFTTGLSQSLYTISGTGAPVSAGLGGYVVGAAVNASHFVAILWNGTDEYLIKKSATGLSGSWTDGAHPTPGAVTNPIIDLVASGTNIFCVCNSQIFYSADGGATWTGTGITGQNLYARDGVVWSVYGSTVRVNLEGSDPAAWPVVSVASGPSNFGPVMAGHLYALQNGVEVRAAVGDLATWSAYGNRTPLSVLTHVAEHDGFWFSIAGLRVGAAGLALPHVGLALAQVFNVGGVVRGVGSAGIYALPKPYNVATEFQLPLLSAAANHTKMLRVK